MADNVTTQSATPATPPAGTVIATDDVAGVQFQRVKLVDGTLDSTAAIAGDATNGLDVDVTRVSGVVHVDDNAGSLTVDAPVGTPLWVRLSDGSAAYVGQKPMATSLPVVIASDQTTLPVSLASVPSHAVTEADGANVAVGVTTDAAVVTDVNGTLSGKLRGLVKWAFERMPTSLGQKNMAGSLPVVVASDQSSVPVAGDVAAGATDAGNPVKTGAVYSVTQPTLTDGQRGNLQVSARGELLVRLSQASGSVTATIQTPFDGIAGAGLATNSYLYGYNTVSGFEDRLRIVSGDGMAGTGLLAQTPMVWNGTTYDRLRGDATNGLKVQLNSGDGVSTLAPKVQNRAGDNVMFVYDPATVRLLEEMLIELRVLNVQQQRLLAGPGTQQADYRADLKLAL